MDLFRIVRRLRERQDDILRQLPPDRLRELAWLEAELRLASDEMYARGPDAEVSVSDRLRVILDESPT